MGAVTVTQWRERHAIGIYLRILKSSTLKVTLQEGSQEKAEGPLVLQQREKKPKTSSQEVSSVKEEVAHSKHTKRTFRKYRLQYYKKGSRTPATNFGFFCVGKSLSNQRGKVLGGELLRHFVFFGPSEFITNRTSVRLKNFTLFYLEEVFTSGGKQLRSSLHSSSSSRKAPRKDLQEGSRNLNPDDPVQNHPIGYRTYFCNVGRCARVNILGAVMKLQNRQDDRYTTSRWSERRRPGGEGIYQPPSLFPHQQRCGALKICKIEVSC
ncbi:hypothetical protein J6590_017063 [Homalodisca vitripennis]|nr:hypothetical protein J6590_017063 [Homalodisca vitripennis]